MCRCAVRRRAADALGQGAANAAGYGRLAHELPDEVTGAWVKPFLEDADVRRDAAAFMRAIDKATMLDAAARLPSLKIPSLVVWGQDDRFFPRELGERLAAALGARLEPIAGARTFVAEDAPEALADAIRGFVRERAAQTRPEPYAADSHSAGNTPGGVDPAHSANSPIACASAGRPAKNGRTSPIVSISREVVAICRSAALTVSPPGAALASRPSSMRSRWPGSERRSARTAPSCAPLRRRSTPTTIGARAGAAGVGEARQP